MFLLVTSSPRTPRNRIAARLRLWSELLWRHTDAGRPIVTGREARSLVRSERDRPGA